MRYLRRLAVCAGLISALWVVTPAASAFTCGQPPANAQVQSGKLTLDTDHSTPNPLDFGDSTKSDSFTEYFNVAGCTISDPSAVNVALRAPGPAKDAFGPPDISPKGTVVVVTVDVNPKKFPAKQIKPVMSLSGNGIDTTLVSLSMQRKQPPALPWILGIAAALVAGAWALLLAFGAAKDKAKPDEVVAFNWIHGLATLVAGAAAAYVVFKSTYLDPATWEASAGNIATLLIGVASAALGGATAGAAAAFKLVKPTKKRREPRHAEPAAVT